MFSKYCHSLKSPICTSFVYSTFIFTSRLLYSTLFSLLLDSQHTFQHGSSGTWFILANCPVFGGTSRFFHPPLDLILSSVPLLNEISPLCPAFFYSVYNTYLLCPAMSREIQRCVLVVKDYLYMARSKGGYSKKHIRKVLRNSKKQKLSLLFLLLIVLILNCI